MNTTLVYDSNCPLCRMYTKAFVSAKLLDGAGRVSFQEITNEGTIKLIDWNRARNEIPFVELNEGNVYYGVDALLKILGSRFAFFRWFAGRKPLVTASKKLYSFISYNRRVIIPGAQKCGRFTSGPEFSLPFRLIYILFTWVMTAFILTSYTLNMESLTGSSGHGREFLICGGQLMFQTIFLFILKENKENIFEYLGNIMTISFAGALALLPVHFAGKLISLPAEAFAFYFLIVAGLMLLEHYRRMKLLRMPMLLTATWVLYRVLILIVILLIR